LRHRQQSQLSVEENWTTVEFQPEGAQRLINGLKAIAVALDALV
jgi:hypothetical protein